MTLRAMLTEYGASFFFQSCRAKEKVLIEFDVHFEHNAALFFSLTLPAITPVWREKLIQYIQEALS